MGYVHCCSVSEMLGHAETALEAMTLYQLVHPEDLFEVRNCHRKCE